MFPGKWSTKVPPVRLPRVRITLAPSLTQPSGPPTCCPPALQQWPEAMPPWVCPVGGGQGLGLLGWFQTEGSFKEQLPSRSCQLGVESKGSLAGEPQASWGWEVGVPGGLCWPRGPGAVMGTRPRISTPDVWVEGNPGSGATPPSPSPGGLGAPSAVPETWGGEGGGQSDASRGPRSRE